MERSFVAPVSRSRAHCPFGVASVCVVANGETEAYTAPLDGGGPASAAVGSALHATSSPPLAGSAAAGPSSVIVSPDCVGILTVPAVTGGAKPVAVVFAALIRHWVDVPKTKVAAPPPGPENSELA